ncbi:mechanosensitive ion channel [Actinotignum urinale]|uniref:mechanosensitive ion channel family protein n=1 Tax=Actinotignum urinale TaxID=190146 RepID=UPI000C80C53F|nr:mechanosensitive ion channel domain-containing protein [Actinotignum urinale]WIK59709.1 mechanosensitive ion channel [Actinotignum urinale]
MTFLVQPFNALDAGGARGLSARAFRFVMDKPSGAPSANPSSDPSIKNLDDVKEAAENAVAATVDIAQLLLVSVASAAVGWIVGIIIITLSKAIFRKSQTILGAIQGIKRPLYFTLATFCGRMGLVQYLARFSQENQPTWGPGMQHFLLICCIGGITWLICGAINGVASGYIAIISQVAEGRKKRAQTQIQVLRRVVNAVICVVGVAAMLITFPAARAAGASLFASAGIVSLVVGIAAQNSLGNIFAGLQLATSDSIRLADIVMWDKQMSTVEEITLSYVVLKVWDGRRLIVPSHKMVSTPFENWTRKTAELMGTVEFRVDWRANIPAMRKELERILADSDLWDGRTGTLVVADSSEHFGLKINAVVSAATPGELMDLRNMVRERMIAWMQEQPVGFFIHTRNYGEIAESSGPATVDDTFSDVYLMHKKAQELQEEREREEAREALGGNRGPRTADLTPTSVMGAESVAKYVAKKKQQVKKATGKKKKARSKKDIASTLFNRRGKNKRKETSKDIKEEKHITGAVKNTPITASKEDNANVPHRVSIEERFKEQLRDTAETNAVKPGHESSIFTGSEEAEKLGHEFAGPEREGEEQVKEENDKKTQSIDVKESRD